jgi:microsomal dipeptidase-like Zn-dependent dipeptidase
MVSIAQRLTAANQQLQDNNSSRERNQCSIPSHATGITVGLVQRGHSDKDIKKILAGNILRVCRDALP